MKLVVTEHPRGQDVTMPTAETCFLLLFARRGSADVEYESGPGQGSDVDYERCEWPGD